MFLFTEDDKPQTHSSPNMKPEILLVVNHTCEKVSIKLLSVHQ